jgi:dipeptidyl-peptidase-4
VLVPLVGGASKAITTLKTDVISVELVESDALLFTAPTAEEPYLVQLWEVPLSGKAPRKLTDGETSHQVFVSPDGKWIIDIAQRWDRPAETRLLDRSGQVVKVLRKADASKFEARGLRATERFTYTAADGKTTLYGTLQLPSDFDPTKKYPLIVAVYGGPESGGISAAFAPPNPLTELGFLVAWFAGRGTTGRGKAFRESIYCRLGTLEIDDQAAGVRALAQRPYVDGGRVGIYGTSYGGYASIMAILRHSDVFHAACACSSVTQWLNYDTVYTERYMGLPTPEDNAAGYAEGSALKYAENLRGKLMLIYGSADNNVHPSNTLQLVAKLEEVGKTFEMRVGPDKGHVAIPPDALYEFFTRALLLSPRQDALATVRRRATRAIRKRGQDSRLPSRKPGGTQ